MSRTISVLVVEVEVISYLLSSAILEPSKLHWNVGGGSASATQVKVALRPTSACLCTGGTVITEAAARRAKKQYQHKQNYTCN